MIAELPAGIHAVRGRAGDSHEDSEAQTAVIEIARELFGERPAMNQPGVRYASPAWVSDGKSSSVCCVSG